MLIDKVLNQSCHLTNRSLFVEFPLNLVNNLEVGGLDLSRIVHVVVTGIARRIYLALHTALLVVDSQRTSIVEAGRLLHHNVGGNLVYHILLAAFRNSGR